MAHLLWARGVERFHHIFSIWSLQVSCFHVFLIIPNISPTQNASFYIEAPKKKNCNGVNLLQIAVNCCFVQANVFIPVCNEFFCHLFITSMVFNFGDHSLPSSVRRSLPSWSCLHHQTWTWLSNMPDTAPLQLDKNLRMLCLQISHFLSNVSVPFNFDDDDLICFRQTRTRRKR